MVWCCGWLKSALLFGLKVLLYTEPGHEDGKSREHNENKKEEVDFGEQAPLGEFVATGLALEVDGGGASVDDGNHETEDVETAGGIKGVAFAVGNEAGLFTALGTLQRLPLFHAAVMLLLHFAAEGEDTGVAFGEFSLGDLLVLDIHLRESSPSE